MTIQKSRLFLSRSFITIRNIETVNQIRQLRTALIRKNTTKVNDLPNEEPLFLSTRGTPYTYSAFYSNWTTITKFEEKKVKYFVRQCVGHPRANHFALALMCLSDRNLTPQSIMNITSVLNARFRDLFNHFKLSAMEEFLPSHVGEYVSGQILPDHSDRQRQSILSGYNTFLFNLNKWLGTKFSDEKQTALSVYM
ncbi:hypothetical protein NV379_25050 [Paenibacillus sp. N1-5-1-14]|uniref:hypothetical protein n=1 Tax=Paenibacillus radicibacter TaxID=2972488 RepID=UPI002158BE70|nr:hypothetical protein [Paenibacillus radicibacter]MCR8645908.1 hypothetical protein [Paenibacillus radicibacter]